MTPRLLSAAMVGAVLMLMTLHPAVAQEKKLSPQQLKMKTCAAQWKDEKAKKNVSGRAAYNTFMRGCLKR